MSRRGTLRAGWRHAAAAVVAFTAAALPVAAPAQQETATQPPAAATQASPPSEAAPATAVAPAPADSVLETPERVPLFYLSTYSRDRGSGNWTQSLSYGIRRGSLTFDMDGRATRIDDFLRSGVGGQDGELSGTLSFRATDRWVFGANGKFSSNVSGEDQNGARQRVNRVQLSTQYTAEPLRGLTLLGSLSSELQEEEGLSYRTLPGQPVGGGGQADTLVAYAQRDSTVLTGRLDGATGQLKWRPATWLATAFLANGSRSRPVTRSTLITYARLGSTDGYVGIAPSEPVENPIDNSLFTASVDLTGLAGLKTSVLLRKLERDEEFFDRVQRGQEHSSLNQRSGTLHVEGTTILGISLLAEGSLSRSFREFRLRRGSTSLVNSRDLEVNAAIAGAESRASLRAQVSRSRSERQTTQNGTVISRFLTGTISHRVSSRLWLDGTGTASFFSYQYAYAPGTRGLPNDRDDIRAFFNIGAAYHVSDRCSTGVHFSTNRSRAVAIGAAASGNNAVQTTYQMDATLLVRPTRRLLIQQAYLLSAVYQIYDYVETRNILSRIKRIDTTVTDTLFPFLTLGLVHNYLFRDYGPYMRETPGADRLFNVTTETFQQNLAVRLGAQPVPGVSAFATQNLGNTRDRVLGTKAETVTNRWTLTLGGSLRRPLPGGASIDASVQRIGAHTERPPECDGPNPPFSCQTFDPREEDYWLVSALLQKAF